MTISPDGSTNFPRPKVPRFNQNVVEDLLDLHVQQSNFVTVWRTTTAGACRWMPRASNSRCPWFISRCEATNRRPPLRYLCTISSALGCGFLRPSCDSRRVRPGLASGARPEHHPGAAIESGIRRNEIESRALSSNLYSPHVDFDVAAALPMADLNRLIQTPLAAAGRHIVPRPRDRRRVRSTDRFSGRLTGTRAGLRSSGRRCPEHRRRSRTRISRPTRSISPISSSPLPLEAFAARLRSPNSSELSVKGEIERSDHRGSGPSGCTGTGSLSVALSGPVQVDSASHAIGLAGIRPARCWT